MVTAMIRLMEFMAPLAREHPQLAMPWQRLTPARQEEAQPIRASFVTVFDFKKPISRSETLSESLRGRSFGSCWAMYSGASRSAPEGRATRPSI